MQKNAKKYGKSNGGLVWGNIRKKTVSVFYYLSYTICYNA